MPESRARTASSLHHFPSQIVVLCLSGLVSLIITSPYPAKQCCLLSNRASQEKEGRKWRQTSYVHLYFSVKQDTFCLRRMEARSRFRQTFFKITKLQHRPTSTLLRPRHPAYTVLNIVRRTSESLLGDLQLTPAPVLLMDPSYRIGNLRNSVL
ncbi:hypothetical protein DFH11DRAFT_1123810 [Phellopilus nigrolimitatus]|nr:hypothetical protein DFH11DRAFT_1123810 [Phellopilus nigrolimitatus]